jgi:hypothetical protein
MQQGGREKSSKNSIWTTWIARVMPLPNEKTMAPLRNLDGNVCISHEQRNVGLSLYWVQVAQEGFGVVSGTPKIAFSARRFETFTGGSIWKITDSSP